MNSTRLELTVAIIKPHVLKVPHALQGIRDMILSNGFFVVRSRRATLSKNEAMTFYREHEGKFFHNRLITLMCSGPSDMFILAKENAIHTWRELMGPTKVFKAQLTHPTTIRGKYGLTDTRNAVHGSDSVTSAEKEIRILFPDFDIRQWYLKEEEKFRRNWVVFDEKLFLHTTRSTEIQ